MAAYCTYSDVNLMTNLSSSDIANADVTSIIAEATKELNSLVNVHVDRERILFIDNVRKNDVDGVNKTYYVKNWNGKYLADMNDDGAISTSDITVYAVYKGVTPNTEAIATITSIDASKGKFVLETAYSSNYELYVTYEWCFKDPTTPDPLIKLACTLLSSAYCYAKVNIGRAPQAAFGNTRIYRHIDSFDMYYRRFLKIINLINNQMPDNRDSEETI